MVRGELKTALDTLFDHCNQGGRFIGRQLIQRLVTSNPSPAYVGRVAAAYAENGRGVRGDLKAVLKAVLLDDEARNATINVARLREPIVRVIQWARSFGASSPKGLWDIGDTSEPALRLGQSPLRSPSVFNFFRPGYVPPNTRLGRQGLVDAGVPDRQRVHARGLRELDAGRHPERPWRRQGRLQRIHWLTLPMPGTCSTASTWFLQRGS